MTYYGGDPTRLTDEALAAADSGEVVTIKVGSVYRGYIGDDPAWIGVTAIDRWANGEARIAFRRLPHPNLPRFLWWLYFNQERFESAAHFARRLEEAADYEKELAAAADRKGQRKKITEIEV